MTMQVAFALGAAIAAAVGVYLHLKVLPGLQVRAYAFWLGAALLVLAGSVFLLLGYALAVHQPVLALIAIALLGASGLAGGSCLLRGLFWGVLRSK